MKNVSRRAFLYGSAAAAGATLLSACSGGDGEQKPHKGNAPGTAAARAGAKVGSQTTPMPKPASFQQSPSLDHKGLPAVEQRLPDSPYVVPHRWVSRGKYGGAIRTCVFGTTGLASAGTNKEFFYGFSPTRWLNDGVDIGPGSADKWSSNSDATEWTIHFRTGLRWSDGHLFDVEDVLFWYYDIAVPQHAGQTVPPDCLSAKGTQCRMSRVDQWTLKISYDSPQPLVPDYLAEWVKGGYGNGPWWVLPKHYLKQFHPKYNPKVPKDWDQAGGIWEQHADWMRNPDCPTLVGYKCKSFDNSRSVVLERNPYYYAVSKEGDQLPYIDEWVFTIYQSGATLKLALQQGEFDYCQGQFNQIDLTDVSTLSATKQKGNYQVLLWDSGSGTGFGTAFYLNYDYIAVEEKYGKLFRDKRFRQAISHGLDRAKVQKTIFFETGTITTGTEGPKLVEFQAKPDGPQIYARWRDSYKAHDVKKAKALLAAMGLTDTNHDGYVEFPDGSELTVDVPYSADASTTYHAFNDQLAADMKNIGLRMRVRPVSPTAYFQEWTSGKLMSHTNDEVSNNGSELVYPQWLVPLENSRWAPLEGNWNGLMGSSKQGQESDLAPIKRHPPRMPPEKGGPVDRLTKLYLQTKNEPDAMKRNQLVWKMMQIHIDEGPFFIGCVANYPDVITRNTELQNVPDRDHLTLHGLTEAWGCPSPAVYDPEIFYWENPDKHTL